MRIPGKNTLQLDEIKDHSLIRELHVYSTLTPVNDKYKSSKVQHQGIGKKLMKKAEQLSLQNNKRNIAVISGVGVRNYYRKLGYELKQTYMVKTNSIFYMIMQKIKMYMVVLMYMIKKKIETKVDVYNDI